MNQGENLSEMVNGEWTAIPIGSNIGLNGLKKKKKPVTTVVVFPFHFSWFVSVFFFNTQTRIKIFEKLGVAFTESQNKILTFSLLQL